MLYIFSTVLITVPATFPSLLALLPLLSVFCIDPTGWCDFCSPTTAIYACFFFYIYSNRICFSSPGLLPSSHSLFLHLVLLSSHWHCGAFPFLSSSALPLSLTLFYALSILSRSCVITFLPVKRWIQGPSPLPLPVAMTTASVFSFIGEGWKGGGGGCMLPSVVTQI